MLTEATNRPFGIELEYSYPSHTYNTLLEVINNKLIELGANLNWGLGIDGGPYGLEVRTPPSTWDNWPVIREIVRTLRPLGRPRRTCGTHLHLDNSDFGPRAQQKLAALWYAMEPAFLAIVPPSRRNNWACYSLGENFQWDDIRHCANHGGQRGVYELYEHRYAFVPNTHHSTIEIRLHACTMSSRKLKNWVYLFQAFANHGQSMAVSDIAEVYNRNFEGKFEFMEEMLHAQLPERRAGRVYQYYCARRESLR